MASRVAFAVRTARLLAFAVAVGAAPGCASRPAEARPHELLERIAPGMSRSEVEAVLGPAVGHGPYALPPRSEESETWYLPPPPLDGLESPFAPGAIGVTFSREGTVVSKRLNPQCRAPAASPRDR
jgi:hypothetical protein